MIDKIKRMRPLHKILMIDFIMVIMAYTIFNYLDIITTDYEWVQWLKKNGLFHIYDSWNIKTPFDYPPLYPTWLYLIRNIIDEPHSHYTQLIMKSLPLLVQFIAQWFIYNKISPEAAVRWSFNLAIIVNVAIYGQRDGIFGLLMILMFYFMGKKKWLSPSIIVAIMCLLKPQGFYFMFILMLYFVVEHISIRKILISLSAALILGLSAFLPFAITSGDYLISIRSYMYELTKHHVFAGCAGNIWGPFEFLSIPEWFENISFMLIFACMDVGIFVYYKTKDFMYTSIVYMFSIFMFTIGQRDRYIMYTMFLLFIAAYIDKNHEYDKMYKSLIISASIIQFGIMFFTNYAVYNCNKLGIDRELLPDYVQLQMFAVREFAILSTLVINAYWFNRLILMKFPNFLMQKERPIFKKI